jgi:hypothetical protein
LAPELNTKFGGGILIKKPAFSLEQRQLHTSKTVYQLRAVKESAIIDTFRTMTSVTLLFSKHHNVR